MELQPGRHFFGTATRLVVEHVRAKAGDDAVARMIDLAGEPRTVEELCDDGGWSSYDQMRALLEAAVEVLGHPRCFDDMHRTISLVDSTTPDTTEMLQELGSPMTVWAQANKSATIMPVWSDPPRAIGDRAVILSFRLADGLEPFPAFCSFMAGMDSLAVPLFGLPVERLEERTCVFRGDERCTLHIEWGEANEQSEVELLRMRVGVLEGRLDAFRATVAELVSDDDLERVLHRTVASAARAMKAPAFVLALDPLPWVSQRVYYQGLSPHEAEGYASRLLDGDACDTEISALVLDVESNKRRYGRLAAINPFEIDAPALKTYARLAATVLDSALALEESRRQAASARALLALSTELAEVKSTEEMAANVVRVTPLVIDCDVAALTLIGDDGVARVRAVHGLTPEVQRLVIDSEWAGDDRRREGFRVLVQESADDDTAAMMELASVQAVATVPVSIDGAPAGTLVVAVRDDVRRITENPEIVQQLRGLAGQVSTALQNAQLLDQIRHQALHDALTGLPNRALILDRADHLLARARRTHSVVAALFIDLDGFKDVNDTLGHASGDQLLRSVAGRLTAAVRESDTIARLGGDEFVVLTESSTLDAGPEVVAERILDVLREPFELDGRDTPLRIGASIGIAVGDRATAGELLRDADVALYEAKAAGKGRYVVFAPEMHTAVTDRITAEMDLLGAIERGEFFLVYQPIFDLATETITGAEALLRWRHPERGVVPPDAFIPVLEESGLIEPVGQWVLAEACRQTATWHAAGHRIDVSVNVSARQLEHDRLVDHVREALRASGLPATSLILEITETTIMRDAASIVRRLDVLKDLGVRVAIDDFGTGYSSLAYLQQFPVDALKIDRSFISAIAESPESATLIHTLVQLGKALGLETLAEGVEDRNQLDRLQHEQCDSGQGFLFARPLEPDDLERFLAEQPPRSPCSGELRQRSEEKAPLFPQAEGARRRHRLT